jgi:OPA family sugar phosphate sensor protein UhpC-like MFS transporter
VQDNNRQWRAGSIFITQGQACVFALTWLTYASYCFGRQNLSVVLPFLTRDYGFTNRQVAEIIFGYSLLYAIGQFCWGPLSDRIGPTTVVGVGLLGIVVANVLMGFQSSVIAFAVLACVNGVAQSTGWPASVKIMAAWFPSRSRGLVMGWWSTNYVLGGFGATLFATFLATNPGFFPGLAWRRAFWGPALVLILVGIAFLLRMKSPSSAAGTPRHEAGEGSEDCVKQVATTEQGKVSMDEQSFRRFIQDGTIWLAGSVYFFVKLIRYAFVFWLPLYMTQHLHYGPTEAGYTSSLYELVGFSGAILAGFASDRLFQSRRFPVAALMLWFLALLTLTHPVVARRGHVFNAMGIALLGAATYGPDTHIVGATAQDLGRRRRAGTAAGFIDGCGSMGQLCSPFVVALVSRRFGWDGLFYVFVALAAAAGSLLIPKWNYRVALSPC